jgi:hypothetical protein
MKKMLHYLLAFAATTITAVTSTGGATAVFGTDAPGHPDSSQNQDSTAVGPDYYSSNDNPFHAD